jgi:hypothetical protein
MGEDTRAAQQHLDSGGNPGHVFGDDRDAKRIAFCEGIDVPLALDIATHNAHSLSAGIISRKRHSIPEMQERIE